jgi:hypothetical protein
VHIAGDDVLDLMADDITLEGANAAFQLHLRVNPGDFARTYNAAQLATGPALAVSTNSPLFLGKRLWEETRIALFRQSVDEHAENGPDDWQPARVSFGHGWIRRSALEPFAEAASLYEPLLPVMDEHESPLDVARAGKLPALRELRLHCGTVWRWNRAVYDDAAGGHLRIELRALPAGPTPKDMIANAAFALGLTLGLTPRADELATRVTFGQARRNFYQAARFGLASELVWPDGSHTHPVPATGLLPALLGIAREGLCSAGVARSEAEGWLAIVAERVERRVTGARWQRAIFEQALARAPGRDRVRRASRAMLERYLELSSEGRPVAEWPTQLSAPSSLRRSATSSP